MQRHASLICELSSFTQMLPLASNTQEQTDAKFGVQEARKAQVPDPGPTVTGRGGGGKIGATSNQLLTQYLLEKGGMQKLEQQIDPREAFLRHKDADAQESLYTSAYRKTQPTKQFAEEEEEEGGQGKK